MALEPGSKAGPYVIKGQLGRGGMASVYEAYDAALERSVALKVLPREFLHDPDFVARFRREATSIASLEHPNIIPIYSYDVDQEEGIPWMAMRLIRGGALSDLLKKQRLPLERSVQILRSVADALDYAHNHPKRIVHRDIKPQNILLDEAGRVYLADFGIAKMLESSGGLTATGAITGTPHYMAPEQATGTKVDARTDVYALGIVAYQMFTGRVPFSADTPVAILMKHVQEPIPLPSPAQVPEALVRAVLKATAKSPADRWPSAGAFAAALESGLESAGAAPPVTEDLPTIELTRTAVSPRTDAVPPTAPAAAPTRVASPTRAASPRGVASPTVPSKTRPTVAVPPVPRSRRSRLLVGLGLAAVLVVLVGIVVVRRLAPVEAPPLAGPATTTARALPPETAVPRPVSSPSVAPTSAPATLPPAVSSQPPAPSRPSPPASAPAVTTLVAHATPPPVSTRPAPTSEPSVASKTTPPPTPEPARPTTPAVPPVVQGLVQSLAAADAGTRWRAAEALGNLGAEARPAVPALTGVLRDRSPDVRWRAAEALGKIGADAASSVPSVAALLDDTDDLVRGEAAKALGRFGSAAGTAVPALSGALRHPEVAFRREVAKALAKIGPAAQGAVPALTVALSDKDKFVRMECARALGNIGPPARSAVTALTSASRDSELLVARQAQEALKKLGPE
jgi:serine/threonine-protein kinase